MKFKRFCVNNKLIDKLCLRWTKDNKILSNGIFICLTILSLSFLYLFASIISTSHQLKTANKLYIEQIADTTANRLKSMTINNNLISMQAELNELTRKNEIFTAIIYDIHSNIRVQSGIPVDRLSSKGSYFSHSQSITQDENIIGQLTVYFTQHEKSQWLLLCNFLIFITCLGILLLFFDNIKKEYRKKNNIQAENNDALIENINNTAIANINLLIQLKNIDSIFKQFSKDSREQHYQSMLSSLKKILKIYNGEIKSIDAQSLTISIQNNDEKQKLLNTLCCADLLHKAASEKQWHIKINTIIYKEESLKSAANLLPSLQYLKNQPGEKTYLDQILSSTIEPFATFDQLDKKINHFIAVIALSEQYQNLLNNQLKHLQLHE